MTQLFINPEIDDYFVEYDIQDIVGDVGQKVRQSIINDYTNEKVILLRRLQFDVDLGFLRSVSFPQKWKWKKLALSRFETIPAQKRRQHPDIAEFVRDVFNGDWGRFDYFLQQATVVNDQIRAALDTIFVNYRFSQRNIIWRFTETRVESLHFDIDRRCDNVELIRLYVNLDDIPRIWYTSGTFTVTANEWYKELDLGRFRGRPHDELLEELTISAFGDWNLRGRDKVHRHLILFEPGDVWLTDGRLVSHQVIYGRRVISSFFKAALDGVPDRNKTFAQRVADLHKMQQELSETPDTVLSPNQLRKERTVPQRQSVDLRSSWEALSEQIRKDTLVRM
jgi:hypothetical protein